MATVEARIEAARVAVVKVEVEAVMMRQNSGSFGLAAAGLHNLRCGESWHGRRGGNLARRARRILSWTCNGRRRGGHLGA